MAETRRPGYQMEDHTSEIVIRLGAPDFPALIGEAGRAFADLVPERLLGGPAEPRAIRVPIVDRAAALVAFLNELVFLAEVESWIPARVASVEESAEGLMVRCEGRGLAAPFVLVKAATLHGSVYREGPDGVSGEVTLDV